MSGRIRRTVQILLHVEDTPHRTALAFGIGVWIAFFPVWGVHTWLALAIAFRFRLSRAVMLIGAWLNNPWTIAPLYTMGTLVGCFLLGRSSEGFNSIDWSLHGWAFYRALLEALQPYLWPFVLGNTVLGVFAGLVGYLGLRALLARRRASKP